MKRIAAALVGLVVIAGIWIALGADKGQPEENSYVGDNAKQCAMCHQRQVDAWEQWPMASAWDLLPEKDQSNSKCIACHSTGYGEPSGFTNLKDTPDLISVQCEECHGPAEQHLAAPMTNPELRRATIVSPDRECCESCHNEKSPAFDGFDYEERLKELDDHLYPKKPDSAE